MVLTAEDVKNYKKRKSVIFAVVPSPKQTRKEETIAIERATTEEQHTMHVISTIFLIDIYQSCFTTSAATIAI